MKVGRTRAWASRASRLVAVLVVLATGIGGPGPLAADPITDVQLIGLAPLYEALFAVANCPDIALDEVAFRRAARLYHLSTTDLTIDGPFSTRIAELAESYRVRLEDDRPTFCSVNRLVFAVPHGVLVERGLPDRPRGDPRG